MEEELLQFLEEVMEINAIIQNMKDVVIAFKEEMNRRNLDLCLLKKRYVRPVESEYFFEEGIKEEPVEVQEDSDSDDRHAPRRGSAYATTIKQDAAAYITEAELKLMENIFHRLRYRPPPESRDSDIGTSESESGEHQSVFEASTRKKPKVHISPAKVLKTNYINMRNGAVRVNKLVTSPQASTLENDHDRCSLRTSKRHKKSVSSSFNSDPKSCPRTSDLPTPAAHYPQSPLTSQTKEVRSPDGQSELSQSIGMQILEELRNIRQDIKSLNDRMKTLEETLVRSYESSSSLDGPISNKVLLDKGVMISPSAHHTITTTGDLNEFISALLLGVFHEDEAKLYRLYPRDASNKAFPQNFIEVAKSQYAKFLERQGHKPPYAKGILNKVSALLSRKATDLGGRRNTGNGKRKLEVTSSCSTEYVIDPITGELTTYDGEPFVLAELSSEMSLTEARAAVKEVENEPTPEILANEERE